MPKLYTIGHSTRTLQEFLDILHAYQITHVVDVRTIPKSRHVPWRCHRSLIADAEIARHFVVWDIMNKTSIHLHKLTTFAKINRKKRPIQIYYPKIAKSK